MKRDFERSTKNSTIWTIIASLTALAFMLFLVFAFVFAATANSYIDPLPYIIALLILAFLFALCALAIFTKSEGINRLAWIIKQRESLIKAILSIGFGTLFAGALNLAAISVSQAQFNLENHSSYPSFELTANDLDGSPEFILHTPVGSAAHISLSIVDRCYFRYEETPCMIEVMQDTKISQGSGSIDFKMRAASFVPRCDFTNESTAEEILSACIGERLPQAQYVSVERCYEIDFFDYQNQQSTYHFVWRDDRLQLAQTSSHYVYENNIRTAVFDTLFFKDSAAMCLESLLDRFEPSDN